MKLASRMIGVAILATVCTVGSMAQLTKGFRGRVVNEEGKPAVGAILTFKNLSNPHEVYQVKTDKKGNYARAGLPYSDEGYEITVKTDTVSSNPKVKMAKLMDLIIVNFDLREDIKLQKKVVKKSPAADAKALYEMGDYEGALAKAKEAIEAKDNEKAALFFKAAALSELGDKDGAIEAFEAYQKAYPGEQSVIGMLAKLYDEKGNKEKADFYKKAFAAAGGVIQGETYNQGVKAFQAGDFAKAASLFEKAAKEDPKDADSHREWARSLVQLGDYPGTIDQLKIYLKMKPDADDAETWRQAISGLEAMIAQTKGKK